MQEKKEYKSLLNHKQVLQTKEFSLKIKEIIIELGMLKKQYLNYRNYFS